MVPLQFWFYLCIFTLKYACEVYHPGDLKIICNFQPLSDSKWKCNYSRAMSKIQYTKEGGSALNTEVFSALPFKLLHMADTQRWTGIIALIVSAARPWSGVDKNVCVVERHRGLRSCPAAVRADDIKASVFLSPSSLVLWLTHPFSSLRLVLPL